MSTSNDLLKRIGSKVNDLNTLTDLRMSKLMDIESKLKDMNAGIETRYEGDLIVLVWKRHGQSGYRIHFEEDGVLKPVSEGNREHKRKALANIDGLLSTILSNIESQLERGV